MVKRPAPAVVWVRLVLAALATALCEASGLALTATAAWLICRAFEQPPLAALSLAVVAVRALAIVRGTLRYGERLAARRSAVRAAYFYSYLGVAWWGVSLAVFLVSFLSYVATDLLSRGSLSTIVGRYSFSIFCGVVLFQIVISIRRQASPVMRGKRATRGLLRAAILPSWADLVIIGALCVMGYFLNLDLS